MPLPDKFVVSGTPEQIAVQLPLLQALYLGLKDLEAKAAGGVVNPYLGPEFKDWFRITLHWGGFIDGTTKKHIVDKSIRLVGVDPATRDLTYLQNLGQRIISKFKNHTYKTGHTFCKYTKWSDGLQTYGYFDNYTTGYNLIESLGDIAGKSIDKELFKYEYRLDPAEAFDPTPSKVPIAGKLVRPRARAPIATMRWSSATILFPRINHIEELCSVTGKVIKDLRFLDRYE